ncbi:MAG: hypothetical protein R3F61_23960 [Myxococcota bacterium]
MHLLLLLACGARIDEPNDRPLVPTMTAMLDHAKSKLTIDKCERAKESRAARCTLIGREADAERFVDGIKDNAVLGRVPGSECQKNGYTRGFSIDTKKIGPEDGGLRINYVFRDFGRVCIDFEFPIVENPPSPWGF